MNSMPDSDLPPGEYAMEHLTAVVKLAKAAELRIQSVLIDLQENLLQFGVKVEALSVDTRNFANFDVNLTIESR